MGTRALFHSAHLPICSHDFKYKRPTPSINLLIRDPTLKYSTMWKVLAKFPLGIDAQVVASYNSDIKKITFWLNSGYNKSVHLRPSELQPLINMLDIYTSSPDPSSLSDMVLNKLFDREVVFSAFSDGFAIAQKTGLRVKNIVEIRANSIELLRIILAELVAFCDFCAVKMKPEVFVVKVVPALMAAMVAHRRSKCAGCLVGPSVKPKTHCCQGTELRGMLHYPKYYLDVAAHLELEPIFGDMVALFSSMVCTEKVSLFDFDDDMVVEAFKFYDPLQNVPSVLDAHQRIIEAIIARRDL